MVVTGVHILMIMWIYKRVSIQNTKTLHKYCFKKELSTMLLIQQFYNPFTPSLNKPKASSGYSVESESENKCTS